MTERELWIKYLGRPKPKPRDHRGPCAFCEREKERRERAAKEDPR